MFSKEISQIWALVSLLFFAPCSSLGIDKTWALNNVLVFPAFQVNCVTCPPLPTVYNPRWRTRTFPGQEQPLYIKSEAGLFPSHLRGAICHVEADRVCSTSRTYCTFWTRNSAEPKLITLWLNWLLWSFLSIMFFTLLHLYEWLTIRKLFFSLKRRYSHHRHDDCRWPLTNGRCTLSTCKHISFSAQLQILNGNCSPFFYSSHRIPHFPLHKSKAASQQTSMKKCFHLFINKSAALSSSRGKMYNI